jgi:two-component system response regulator
MSDEIQILLVEDNEDDIELTLHAFTEHRLANRIHVVHDGAAALEFLFGDHADDAAWTGPRVILLDLKLPLVDGLEVLRTIKGDDRTRTIPVVVMTSSRAEIDVVRAYDLGVNSYIVKPVDFDQFSEVMRTLGAYWLIVNEPPRRA